MHPEPLFALIIDDCPTVRSALEAIMASRKLPTLCVPSVETARQWLENNLSPKVIVLDLDLGDGPRGEEFLHWYRQARPGHPVVVLTGDARVETCVRAMREGAYHYICKPFKMRELLRVLHEAAASAPALQDRRETAPGALFPFLPPEHFDRLAQSAAPLLIRGETGTGKEYFARALHRAGPRASGSQRLVKCRALSERNFHEELLLPLLNSTAAATSSRENSATTILLDEVAELPLDCQGRLVRLLEEHVRPPSGARTSESNLRVMATSSAALEDCIRDERFRPDLFYRLSVLSVVIPPLRDRRNELTTLVPQLLAELRTALGPARAGHDVPTLSADAWRLLRTHPFPGNIRQLRNVLESALTLSPHSELTAEDFPQAFRNPPRPRKAVTGLAREDFEHLIQKHQGSNKRVAEEMGVDPATVWRLKKRLGLLVKGETAAE